MSAEFHSAQQSEELAQLVRRLYRALCAGDIASISPAISDDPFATFIGTDDEEWWVGRETIAQIMSKQVEESPGSSFVQEMRPDGLLAWAEGSVGWAVDHPLFITALGAELRSRFTAVFRLEGLQWKIVQAHYSVGQANEELWGFHVSTSIESIAENVNAERPDLSNEASNDGTVTIVFTDIEASTETAERLGDRRWMDLLHWHNALVSEEAERHYGTIVKSQGDGFMLAFASASNALDFAVAFQARTREGFLAQPVRVRVGVNAGDVIRERDDFYGHAVTVAARVAAQALGRETLVTELVAGLVAGVDRFKFGPMRVAELKGLDGDYALKPMLVGA